MAVIGHRHGAAPTQLVSVDSPGAEVTRCLPRLPSPGDDRLEAGWVGVEALPRLCHAATGLLRLWSHGSQRR
jgi:hypothetical protein